MENIALIKRFGLENNKANRIQMVNAEDIVIGDT